MPVIRQLMGFAKYHTLYISLILFIDTEYLMGFKNAQGIVPRKETRRDRYNARLNTAQTLPFSIATIHLQIDGNLGYIIRCAACFGAKMVYVIGSVPSRPKLMPSSGSLVDYMETKQFSTIHDFIEHTKLHNIKLVAAELCEGAVSLFDYRFDFEVNNCIVVGNEEFGISGDILAHSDKVYIPMVGCGHCLNTAQTANIMSAEYTRQWMAQT